MITIPENPVLEFNNFKVGKTYRIRTGIYKSKNVILRYVNPKKQIIIRGKMHNQVSCELLEDKTIFNTVLENLCEIPNLNEIVMVKNLSPNELLKLAKKKDKEAIKEYIRRYKKLPK